MIQINVSHEDRFHLEAGDMKTLRKVLEAEAAKVDTQLREQANADNFRLYQGVSQTLSAVIKLLP